MTGSARRRSTQTELDGDARTLLGLHTRTAWFVFALNALVNLAIIGSLAEGLSPLWPVLLAWATVVAGGACLLVVAGDPLPRWATGYIVASGPAAVACTVVAISPDSYDPHEIWMTGPVTAVLAYLCVRGRPGAAWLGEAATVAAVMCWAAYDGRGALDGLLLAGPNFAVLGMATFFAYTIRPAASSVYRLRDLEAARAAEQARAYAILDVRNQRIGQLDDSAGPLLTLIATGAELTTQQRLECRLLEAQLRDGLRGAALAHGAVVPAARTARMRGVEVVLLDDGGIGRADSVAAQVLRETVAAELSGAVDGSVTARVLPPGRTRLGTLVADSTAGYRRLEFGHDGAVVSVLVDE